MLIVIDLMCQSSSCLRCLFLNARRLDLESAFLWFGVSRFFYKCYILNHKILGFVFKHWSCRSFVFFFFHLNKFSTRNSFPLADILVGNFRITNLGKNLWSVVNSCDVCLISHLPIVFYSYIDKWNVIQMNKYIRTIYFNKSST